MNVTLNEERIKATIEEDVITAVIDEEPVVAHFSDETVIIVGESQPERLPAGESLSALRVVFADVEAYYADHDYLPSMNVIGITVTAAIAGDDVSVMTSGKLSDPSWSWVAGPIYVGADGALTQTAPTTGFVQEVARAISPTDIIINIQPPILLA